MARKPLLISGGGNFGLLQQNRVELLKLNAVIKTIEHVLKIQWMTLFDYYCRQDLLGEGCPCWAILAMVTF